MTDADRGGKRRLGALLAALTLLSVLSGCVVYVPYSGPPQRYHYWR
jgi:hypothetical protein